MLIRAAVVLIDGNAELATAPDFASDGQVVPVVGGLIDPPMYPQWNVPRANRADEDVVDAFRRRGLNCDIRSANFPEVTRQLSGGMFLDGAGVPGVPAGAQRGIPIGNLTSQFWANVYLDPLDHHVRDALGLTAYVRYMDDILVLAHRKAALWDACAAIRGFARDRLRLAMKDEETTVAPVTEGIPWLGFRVFPGTIRVAAAGRRRFGRKGPRKNNLSAPRSSRRPAGKERT